MMLIWLGRITREYNIWVCLNLNMPGSISISWMLPKCGGYCFPVKKTVRSSNRTWINLFAKTSMDVVLGINEAEGKQQEQVKHSKSRVDPSEADRSQLSRGERFHVQNSVKIFAVIFGFGRLMKREGRTDAGKATRDPTWQMWMKGLGGGWKLGSKSPRRCEGDFSEKSGWKKHLRWVDKTKSTCQRLKLSRNKSNMQELPSRC